MSEPMSTETMHNIIIEATRGVPTDELTMRHITDRVIALRNLTRENGLPMRVLGAIPIPATIKSVEYEKSSTRLVISYVPLHPNDGEYKIEKVRSDRTDTKDGKAISDMWHDAVGKRVVIYKTTEKTGDVTKPSVRIAPYMTPLR